MKAEAAVLISPSLMSFTVSVDVKQHWVELTGVCQRVHRSCVRVEMPS